MTAAGYWACADALLLFGLLLLRRPTLVKGTSMLPTVRDRELLWLDVTPWRGKRPERGQIVVLWNPERKRLGPRALRRHRLPVLFLLKRVIALGGDTVEVREGVLYLNGEPQEEPWLRHDRINPAGRDFAPVTVPSGMCFVLGDNRMVSRDSRRFGCVPVTSVCGSALRVLWPPDRARRLRQKDTD